jgi:hypothetical protein
MSYVDLTLQYTPDQYPTDQPFLGCYPCDKPSSRRYSRNSPYHPDHPLQEIFRQQKRRNCAIEGDCDHHHSKKEPLHRSHKATAHSSLGASEKRSKEKEVIDDLSDITLPSSLEDEDHSAPLVKSSWDRFWEWSFPEDSADGSCNTWKWVMTAVHSLTLGIFLGFGWIGCRLQRTFCC